MRNVKLILSYDGTAYCGWQVQPGRKTVCGVLREKITVLTGSEAVVHSSSRTDSGVHAACQVVNFRTGSSIPPPKIKSALNGALPADIVVVSAAEAPDDFHARYSAARRKYRYTVRNAPVRSPFDRLYCYHFPYTLDVPDMRKAAGLLTGKHDFSAFKSARGEKINRIRTVFGIDVLRSGEYIYMDVEADGFLTYMVRNIAGTLLEVGRGRLEPAAAGLILESGDRKKAGPTLPARGLCLVGVEYFV